MVGVKANHRVPPILYFTDITDPPREMTSLHVSQMALFSSIGETLKGYKKYTKNGKQPPC